VTEDIGSVFCHGVATVAIRMPLGKLLELI
jgi:hypothetical protein